MSFNKERGSNEGGTMVIVSWRLSAAMEGTNTGGDQSFEGGGNGGVLGCQCQTKKKE
jgi:hypothetical protein